MMDPHALLQGFIFAADTLASRKTLPHGSPQP